MDIGSINSVRGDDVMYNHYSKSITSRVLAVFLSVLLVVSISCFDIAGILRVENTLVEAVNSQLDPSKEWSIKMRELGWVELDSNGNIIKINDSMWNSNDLPKLTFGYTGSTNITNIDGTTIDSSLLYTVEYDRVLGKNYRKYYISNANQLERLMYLYGKYDRFRQSLKYIDGDADTYNPSNEVDTQSLKPENYQTKTYDELDVGLDTALNSFEDNSAVIGDSDSKISLGIDTTIFSNRNSSPNLATATNNNNGIRDRLTIVLLNDIDLGGMDGVQWTGYKSGYVLLEIDGQGHTIYNGIFENSNFFGTLNLDQGTNGGKNLYIHNITFSNMVIARFHGIFGSATNNLNFNNVNFSYCVASKFDAENDDDPTVVGKVTIVLGGDYASSYFKDCTINDSYVFGQGHCSTFGSYNRSISYEDYNYIGKTSTTPLTNGFYTDIPNDFESIEECMTGKTITYGNIEYTLASTYPSIFEGCASVDCYIYDTKAHSGTFVSCSPNGLVFKRCFTNSSIYASVKTGVFIGAIFGSSAGFIYPIDDEDTLINSYFDDCYTSGLVEGNSEIGGFIGTVFNDSPYKYNRAYQSKNQGKVGKVVFSDCYTTSLVGLEYSGIALGGFIGSLRGANEKNHTDKKHLFKNCYSAGEVGNILTDTDEGADNSIGGFIGTYDTNYSTFELKNCYYDKQTTAMRERAIGNAVNNWAGNGDSSGELEKSSIKSSLPLDGQELIGMYTLTSSNTNYYGGNSISSITGLADSTDIMESNSWRYVKGYYPQLETLIDYNSNVTEGDNQLVKSMKYDRSMLYYRCSLASTSTVFLEHYSRIMDDTGELTIYGSTDVYDTVRDITSIFTFTSQGNSEIPKDVSTAWYLSSTLNDEHEYTPTLGLPYEYLYNNNVTNTYGYTDYFTLTDIYGTQKDISYQRYVEVLTIVPSNIDTKGNTISNGDYVYKCTDFAPGKQWITVYVADENYINWKSKKSDYDQYVTQCKTYKLTLDTYANLLGEGILISEELDSIQEYLDYKDAVLTRLSEVLNSDTSNYSTSTLRSAVVELLSSQLNSTIPSDISGNELYLQCEKYLTNQCPTETMEEPIEVAVGDNRLPNTDKSNKGTQQDRMTCTRNIRLLPKAYVDAGVDMKIYVKKRSSTNDDELNTTLLDNQEDTYNTFKLLDIDNYGNSIVLDTFQHGVTTSYCITNRTKLRSSTGVYSKQVVQDYTNDIDNANAFAVKSTFPSVEDSASNNPYQIGLMCDMAMIGDSAIKGESRGQTIVKVYTAVSKDGILRVGKRVSGEALKEWQEGNFNGVENPDGYYYMLYFWRLNDGRYLSDTKLVQISTEFYYNVSMTSAILGAETEPTKNVNGIEVATIDVQVLDDQDTNVNSIQFPSDESGYQEDKYTYTDGRYTGRYIQHDGKSYLAKTVDLTTSNSNVTVAWRRDTDYILKTLTIEVAEPDIQDSTHSVWVPMVNVTYNTDGSYSFDYSKYSYNFTSLEYIHNKEENTYTLVKTAGVMREFVLEHSEKGLGTSTITFDFENFTENVSNKLKRVRCTAYFAKVSASVSVDKYVLIDDGATDVATNTYDYIGIDRGVINVESYREVNNYDFTSSPIDFQEQKSILSGDVLIYRNHLRNDGYYTAQTTNLYETLPEGVHLVDDSVRIYQQYKDVSNVTNFGSIEFYQDNGTITQKKNLQLPNSNTIDNVVTSYSISESVDKDGYTVGKYSVSNMIVNGNNIPIGSSLFYEYNDGDPLDGELYCYKVYQVNGKTSIDWTVYSVSMEYDYFLEYRVIVDDIGIENHSITDFISYTKYDNLFSNGSTIANMPLGHLNRNYRESSIMKFIEYDDMESAEIGNNAYTIEFSLNDNYIAELENTHNYLDNTYFEAQMDEYFTFNSLTVYKYVDDVLANGYPLNFSYNRQSQDGIELQLNGSQVVLTGLDIDQYTKYKMEIVGSQSDTSNGVVGKFVLVYDECKYVQCVITDTFNSNEVYYTRNEDGTYTKASVDSTTFNDGAKTNYYVVVPTKKDNTLHYIADNSNITNAKATWLYLNVKKYISEDDPSQTFIFKIERFDSKESYNTDTFPSDTFYVNIRCKSIIDDESTKYVGEQSIILGKRGYYKITEVTSWSATDYETTSYDLYNNSMDYVGISIPVDMYRSTAIKLSTMYNQSQVGNTTLAEFPTVVFSNVKKNQVWKTSQAYAENNISLE